MQSYIVIQINHLNNEKFSMSFMSFNFNFNFLVFIKFFTFVERRSLDENQLSTINCVFDIQMVTVVQY